MPMSQSYKDRLFPILPQLAAHYGTPFHIYDEAGIRATGTALNQAFAGIPGFREYFAVKALPNPRILEVLSELGFGVDCSSIAELMLVAPGGRARRGHHVHLEQYEHGGVCVCRD